MGSENPAGRAPAALPFASSRRRRSGVILLAFVAMAAASLVLACTFGSVRLSLPSLWLALADMIRGRNEGLAITLLGLRMTRALAAFSTGAGLALAGVMMQALLRNPLADPYVLGVSGGAAVGALAAMLFGGALWTIDAASLAGAVTISLVLFLLARRDLCDGMAQGSNASSLLLTGVILASGCGALITLLLSIAPDGRLRGMIFWLIGDLSATQLHGLPWIVLAAALAFSGKAARAINVMAQHGQAALSLGIRVAALRQALFVCAAALTASAVTSAGSIGFVGLIVPHACRFALGPDHRLLLPSAALAGGTFLVIADTIARTVLAPQQLPVGVITALIGVPAFLWQLHYAGRTSHVARQRS